MLQVSRLTTPGGGFDSRLSFGEWSRQQAESEPRREFNVAVVELARSRKLVRAGGVRGSDACGAQPVAATPSTVNQPVPQHVQNSRALLLLCWMISQGGGIVPDDLVRACLRDVLCEPLLQHVD